MGEAELRALLRSVRQRWIVSEGLLAGARGLAAAAALITAAAVLVKIAGTTSLPLVLLASVTLAGAVGVIVWSLWPLRRTPNDGQVARFVEEKVPELEDRLVSAVEIAGKSTRSRLTALLLRDAADRVRHIDLDVLIGRSEIKRRAIMATTALAALAAAAFFAKEPAQLAFQTAWVRLYPPTLALQVVPGNARIRAGESLQIRARITGLQPGVDLAIPVLRVGVEETALEMTAEGQEFVATVPAVAKDFVYRVTAGELASETFQVSALEPARVAQIDLQYRYPAFSGLPVRTEEDGGDVYAPPGTTVRLTIHTDKAVERGALTIANSQPVPLQQLAENRFEAELVVARDGSYRVALSDIDGLANAGDTEYFIRTMDDAPPDVRIVQPAGDRQVTPLEEVTIEARADDDFGVDKLELVYSVRGGPEKAVPLKTGKAATSVTGQQTLFVEDFGVQPGDFVTYYARARDVGRGKPPSVAQSDIFFLEVRPFNEEFVSAQSQAMMGGGGGGPVDDLAAAQKDIMIATWKLERRASAGKSAADIKSIAAAQGELKEKAEQLANRMAGPRAAPRRQGQPPVQEPPSPIRLAAEAMGKAQASLDKLSTNGALPHEAEALNQLLKAEAEIRRRQVAQQQNGGGGGQQRANQDLSALFDRELLRQQQTNYETPSSIEERQAQENTNSALDKVRDLARRQDDLARRQRELARQRQSMTEEEFKRQLEKLTREQAELRKQAEAVSSQMAQERDSQGQQQQQQKEKGQQSGQPSGQSSGSKQSGQSGSGGSRDQREGIREAAEQMKGAAGELQKSEVEDAAARAKRAAEQLREVERQLRGTEPDERRRAVAELQVEAQQLAEAQRALARETGRAGKGEGEQDALRRMAGEQSRLADRVDQLDQHLSELQSSAQADDGPLAEAAEELRKQAVGQTMRSLADQLQKAAGGGERSPEDTQRLADGEQAVSSAMSTVAERMRAAAGGDREARRLSEQLGQVRDARDRLTELERQIDRLGREPGNQSAQRGNNERNREGASSSEQNASQGRNQQQATGRQQSGSEGKESGGEQPGGGSSAGGEMSRLQQEYSRELKQTQELLDQMGSDRTGFGQGMGTPDEQQYSHSAPGTEAFKQDFARWDVLRRDVNSALEKLQNSLSDRIAEREARDRLNNGGDERAPDEYRQQLSEYYRSLARRPGGKS